MLLVLPDINDFKYPKYSDMALLLLNACDVSIAVSVKHFFKQFYPDDIKVLRIWKYVFQSKIESALMRIHEL